MEPFVLLAITLTLLWLSLGRPRETIFGPVVFTWTGVTAGGLVALTECYEIANDRVRMEYILPAGIAGAICGAIVGALVRRAYLLGGRRARGTIEVLATAILFAGIGAIWGWLVGDKRLDNPPATTLTGAAALADLGIVLGFLQWWRHDHRSNGANSKDGSTNATQRQPVPPSDPLHPR
jgi:membrane associated rhomboid family serine protease